MAEKKADEFFTRPPTLSRGQQFSKFLYNSSTGELLGRTAKSWAQITVFYIVLYAFLAGFFAALLTVFFQTLDETTPTWTMHASLLGANPGMGYRPLHPSPDQSVIAYTPGNADNIAMWANATDAFLQPYYEKGDHVTCDYGTERESTDKPCRFPVELNKCTAKNSYGFAANMPCIFLKMNKIYGWTPEPYTKEQIENNTMGMPEKLRSAILALPSLKINHNVWVSCMDAEKGNVTLEYDGHPGFPSHYFPYTNQKSYQNPFVVMQVHNLPSGTVSRINCQLWAQNIVVDRQRRLGMTSLELLSN